MTFLGTKGMLNHNLDGYNQILTAMVRDKRLGFVKAPPVLSRFLTGIGGK